MLLSNGSESKGLKIETRNIVLIGHKSMISFNEYFCDLVTITANFMIVEHLYSTGTSLDVSYLIIVCIGSWKHGAIINS
jgi:hypothetical protein